MRNLREHERPGFFIETWLGFSRQESTSMGNPFDIGHLRKDLKGRAVRGFGVTASAQVVKLVLQMGATAVLARILSPEDYGLMAMVIVVTGFVSMFKDAGLTMATVQVQELSHEQVSTLFWINVALSVVLGLIVLSLSPAIAWFYGEPRLTNIAAIISISFLFSGCLAQHQALLRRQMRFKNLAIAEILSMAMGAVVAVILGLNGWGYWALVAQMLVSSFTNCVVVWFYSGWMPGAPRKGADVASMLRFGANVTGFNFINYLARNTDNLLIGWWWGSAALGIYSKAYGLLLVPVRQINAPIGAVVAPTLSRLKSEPEQFRASALKMFRMVAIGCGPVAAFLMVFSEEVVMILLGDQWVEAVPIFRWLSVVLLTQMILNQTANVFTAQGRTDLLLKCGAINSAWAVIAIVAGLPWGAVGVACLYGVSGLLLRAPTLIYFMSRTKVFRQRDLYASIAPVVILTLSAATLVLGLKSYLVTHLGHLPGVAISGSLLALVFVLAYSGVGSIRKSIVDGFKLFDVARRRKKVST
ncbi:lipopolysaccharide biosynthesis protein [Haloferula sp.]|uniref:lipopolysaccharide biosynthesis protein n=1 Tax=Haloferula sp. TaxID=2497595 RepID=UPI003C71B052